MPITNAKRDFRLEPDQGGFEEVCAFHHMANAMQFFRRPLGSGRIQRRAFRTAHHSSAGPDRQLLRLVHSFPARR